MTNDMIIKYNLIPLQNHEANVYQDHLTICGFFTDEQQFSDLAAKLTAQIEQYEARS